MRLTIHRSANEIGGNCIELESNGCRLLLDAGFPLDPDLSDRRPNELLPRSLDINTPIDALLLSHPHKDHYGLLSAIPSNTKIWCGKSALALIRFNSELFDEPLSRGVQTWAHQCPIQIGPFNVTPFLTDHSAFDAYMLLLECESKRILYTGDFRITGRKSRLVDAIIQNPPENIDVLIMEGTNLARSKAYPSENDIEGCLAEHFLKTKGRIFITSSAQNIDRTVSIYRACLRSHRTFVVDIYTSYILELIHSFSSSIPALGWKNLKCVVTSSRIKWFRRSVISG